MSYVLTQCMSNSQQGNGESGEERGQRKTEEGTFVHCVECSIQ